MTLLLALDTATDRATIALGRPGTPAREVALAARRELSRDIERVTAELLRRESAQPRDLTAVVVADGPGSFTGLRIGIAFAKGVCRALGIPLWATPSMLGAAITAVGARSAVRDADPAHRAPRTVVVEYDALRGEVYRAVYGFEGGAVVTVAAPGLAAAGSRADGGPGVVVTGEAQASAASLIELCGMAGGAVLVPEPAGWEPSYGRPAEAEARRLAREGAHER